MESIINTLRAFRGIGYKLANLILLKFAEITLSKVRKKVALTNSPADKVDGTGAQIQRLLASVALARFYQLPFIQQPFVDISVHPLDPFQNLDLKKDFIQKLNWVFRFEDKHQELEEHFIRVTVNQLTTFAFLVTLIRASLRPQCTLIEITEPYGVTNLHRNIFVGITDSFPNWTKFTNEVTAAENQNEVVIHHRQGVGGMAIYPGQKIPREMPLEYFVMKAGEVIKKKGGDLKFLVLTDAPPTDLVYNPSIDQESHWLDTPGYTERRMFVSGNDLVPYFHRHGLRVDVRAGGDPLEAIAIMSRAKVLIISRSSLSYVAGLLNIDGEIHGAPGFWHPSPSSWI
jgi:hypothetical protein